MGGRLTLIGWLILAAVCLSPLLAFWMASTLGRFLRRKRQSRALTSGGEIADRSRSTGEDKTVDAIDRAR